MENCLRDRDIVVIGLQPWDIEIGSNCKNIAQELARHNRVLYVNRALDRLSLIKFRNDPKIRHRREGLKKKEVDLQEKEKNLWVFNPKTILESTTRVPVRFVFEFFNRLNNRRMAREISKAMDWLHFSQAVIFIDNDFFRTVHLRELLPHDKLIYYIRDYLVEQRHFRPHGRRMEQELIRKADMVATNSEYLADYAAKYTDKAFFIGQGCDFTYFDHNLPIPEPEDMRDIPHPRIGYVGFLTAYRLDPELIAGLAAQRPDWSFVLVGPQDEVFSVSELHQLNNIYFLGPKDKRSLASYIKYFDVCMNPQVKNTQTEGNYPLKIDEYLAMGKPVVATRTRAMEMFEEYVSLSIGANEYIASIEKALDNDMQQQERIAFARSHTWENCVANLERALKTSDGKD